MPETLFAVPYIIQVDEDKVQLLIGEGEVTYVEVRMTSEVARDMAHTLVTAAVEAHGNRGRVRDEVAGEAGGPSGGAGEPAEEGGVSLDGSASGCACGGDCDQCSD